MKIIVLGLEAALLELIRCIGRCSKEQRIGAEVGFEVGVEIRSARCWMAGD